MQAGRKAGRKAGSKQCYKYDHFSLFQKVIRCFSTTSFFNRFSTATVRPVNVTDPISGRTREGATNNLASFVTLQQPRVSAIFEGAKI